MSFSVYSIDAANRGCKILGNTARNRRTRGNVMMTKARNTTGKVACYVRVSTVGQNESSQRAEIRKWLEGNGLAPADAIWYVDKESGDTLDRPKFGRLQQDVFAGAVRMVCVYKLDRLSRSLQDGVNTLCEWLNRGVRLVSVTQGFDFAGVTGKLIASVLFAVAEMEQETRRERQAAGIAAAKERGVYIGRQPGFRKGKPQRVAELRKRGLNDSEIGEALGVSRRTVQRYMREVE